MCSGPHQYTFMIGTKGLMIILFDTVITPFGPENVLAGVNKTPNG